MDLFSMIKHFAEGINHPKYLHVVMLLRGRFMNKIGEMEHLKPLATETESELKVRVWFERMLVWYEQKGIVRGPVFRDERGNWVRAKQYEVEILTQLEWIQTNLDDLISPNVNVFEDMGVGRGFRCGSNGRAVSQEVSQTVIDLNNRWSMCERAKGKKMSLNMCAHYTDLGTPPLISGWPSFSAMASTAEMTALVMGISVH